MNWMPPRNCGIWNSGIAAFRYVAVAAPWCSLALIFATYALVNGKLVRSPGMVFELPAFEAHDGDVSDSVALVMTEPDAEEGRNVRVFFNDARFLPSDGAGADKLKAEFSAKVSGTLILLVDRRIDVARLMKIVNLAREAGVKRVQIAEKRD